MARRTLAGALVAVVAGAVPALADPASSSRGYHGRRDHAHGHVGGSDKDHSGDNGAGVSRSISARNDDPNGVRPTGAGCSTEPTCVVAFSGTTTWSGAFKGRSSYVLHFTSRGDGSFNYRGVEHLDVTVDGCGSGTFDIAIRDGIYRPLDNPGGTVYDHDVWSTVPGTGSGQLLNISGGGNETVTDNPNGSSSTALTGSIRCGPPADADAGRGLVPTTGTFTLDGCAPDSVPTAGADQSFEITCKSPATFAGTWTGVITETSTGTINADGSVTGVNDVDLTGTAPDGTCGGLHWVETFTEDAIGNEQSAATILSGSGDWSGSRGSFTTTGFIPGGVGSGTWTGTWARVPISGPSSCATLTAND